MAKEITSIHELSAGETKIDLSTMSLSDALAYLEDEESRGLVDDFCIAHQEQWVAHLQEEGFAWIVVCRGEVVKSSYDRMNFLSNEDLEQIAIEHDAIPFAYVRPPIIRQLVS